MGNITKLVILLVLVEAADVIQVKDGGYEEVYIFVQDTNEENEFLLKRIQVHLIPSIYKDVVKEKERHF